MKPTSTGSLYQQTVFDGTVEEYDADIAEVTLEKAIRNIYRDGRDEFVLEGTLDGERWELLLRKQSRDYVGIYRINTSFLPTRSRECASCSVPTASRIVLVGRVTGVVTCVVPADLAPLGFDVTRRDWERSQMAGFMSDVDGLRVRGSNIIEKFA